MSGGYFQYNQHKIREIADELAEVIRDNDSTDKNEYGEDKGQHLPPEVIYRFNIAYTILRMAEVMTQRIDWLLSCDDGVESFMRRWDEELQNLATMDTNE